MAEQNLVNVDNVTISGDGIHEPLAAIGGFAGRIAQTFRVVHTVTAPEIAAFFFTIAAVWPVPFPDANYTVVDGIVAVSLIDPTAEYSVIQMDTKSAAGINASVIIDFNPTAGDEIEVDLIAIHD